MASTLLAGAIGQRLLAGARFALTGHPRLLRAFSWRGLGVFFVFTAALTLWTWSGVLLWNKTIPLDEHVYYLLLLMQRHLLVFFPIYLLVALADGVPARGRWRFALLAGALAVGVLASVQVRCAVTPDQLMYVYGSHHVPYCSTFPTVSTYFDLFHGAVVTPLTISAMVMVLVFVRRRDAELIAAIAKARALQLETRRRRIESDIAAVESRIDPARLFETLRAIRARYDADLDQGEAMLDRLIEDLRAAARRPVPGPEGAP